MAAGRGIISTANLEFIEVQLLSFQLFDCVFIVFFQVSNLRVINATENIVIEELCGFTRSTNVERSHRLFVHIVANVFF